MADTLAKMTVDLIPVHEKKGRSRRALKPKNQTPNETNILAGKISQPSPSPLPLVGDEDGKENSAHLSQPRTRKQTKKGKESKQSFEKELQEIQEKLEQMRLEKEKTEELLKVRDEMLKQKEEELETRGKQQEKMQLELKKLQKLKEFKPTVSFAPVQSLREKEQEKNVKKKKKAGADIKKPSPAYILWCKDQWNEVKKENPDAEFKEISNILGSKWKNLSPEEKKPFEEKNQADKEAYLQIIGKEKRENEAMKLLEEEQKQKTAMELLDQYLQFKQGVEKEGKKTRKEKDPLKPKHPLSAFFLFSKDRRATLLQESTNILEIAKLAGEEWKNMTEEQRGPYEEMAKQKKEKYLREMEMYKQKKEEEAAIIHKEEEEQMKIQKQEALQLLKKKEKAENIIKKTKENRLKKKKQNSDPKRPKKPASSFFLFSKEMRKELLQERPGISYSTLNALISVKWKELNDEDKQLWNVKAAEAREAYKKEMEEYNKSMAMIANNP
ncbi:high mobility group B protein 13-like isoform X2 [Macadamia integrifolia]|uniref:high mobility group B protein 13-like isoform X2 n=1 Tax=Macadamia integrifolia TaxID=60698 RepID=UPI001C5316AF|nr:high mobility group B protein 13-like isoform X2 [Macadamia integrifolia]